MDVTTDQARLESLERLEKVSEALRKCRRVFCSLKLTEDERCRAATALTAWDLSEVADFEPRLAQTVRTIRFWREGFPTSPEAGSKSTATH
jgi:hypothetical protein